MRGAAAPVAAAADLTPEPTEEPGPVDPVPQNPEPEPTEPPRTTEAPPTDTAPEPTEPPPTTTGTPPAPYSYAEVHSYEEDPVNGVAGWTTVERPAGVGSGEHSLFEVAIVDNGNIIEVGWRVQPGLYGDNEPHLFVFHWVNNQPRGTDGLLQPLDPPISPGQVLEPSTTPTEFRITHYGGSWWLNYGFYTIGSFPDSEWNGEFTQAHFAKWFGEVYSDSATQCVDMGNGQHGDGPDGAVVSYLSVLRVHNYGHGDQIDWYPPSQMEEQETNPALWSVGNVDLAGRWFRYGGPGAC